MRKGLAGIILAVAAGPAAGQASLETMQLADGLAGLIAHESVCGYVLDPAAVERHVAERLPPGDLSFAGMLEALVAGKRLGLGDLGAAERAARCAALSGAGRELGLIAP